MKPRSLEVRLEAYNGALGYLKSTDNGEATFSYSDRYLSRADRVPVSLALPLREEPFDDQKTRAFFDNLLPENDQLKQVMEREGLDRTDIVGLLYYLGSDCPGAISCIPFGEEPVKIPGVMSTDYDALDTHDVKVDAFVSHQFSFSIGNAENFDTLTRADVEAFLAAFGIAKTRAARFISQTIGPIAEKLDRAAESLTKSGLKDFDDLIGREINGLTEILELSLPIRGR
jgi:HipA-like protein